MRKLMISLCALAMIAAVSGCSSKPEGEGQIEGQRTLTVSTWGLSEDVLVEDVYGPFEELCNCKVILETDTTANRYTKLSTNPDSTVDVIELSQAAAANGYVADLFEKIDTTQIPNLDNIIDGAKSTVAQGYGPAYTLNSIGIIYDKEAVGFEITSWADLWKPELAGKLSIPELSTTFGPAMVYLASDYKGVDITTDDGAAAFEALNELKSNIVRTYSKSSDLANMFEAGEIAVAVVGDFGVPVIKNAAPNVEFVVPADYTYANFNTIDINKNSKNKDLAYMYINWRISQELQSVTAVTLNEGPVNKNVELTPEQSANMTYGDVAERAKSIDYSFVNPLMAQWTDQWNRTINN